MFILVNIILTGVLSIIDKMLGWQRAGGEGILTTIYGVLIFFAMVGGAVSAFARHGPFGVVATAAADPGHRLAGDSGLQLPKRNARK
ncbi:Inner membrane protein yhaH [Raoultella terrigena]|uniref:Inner membrane protein yhaH n=1 Tax=Raoultella terrigena TaxID=577 RepID=A0A4U9D6V7_RAOTE|nr:Inner membrane protein yhaH [Raoultella terrigena]